VTTLFGQAPANHLGHEYQFSFGSLAGAASPWRRVNLPQVRLEPLLKARAEELSPGRIRFGHELTNLEQDEHGVQALIRDNASGREYVGRAAYLIGADGGRLVHRLIGVEYEGLGMITQTATLYISPDFSRCAPDPDVLIRLPVVARLRRCRGSLCGRTD
jgi:2,4-dichlorophenol 6-monooxygenase